MLPDSTSDQPRWGAALADVRCWCALWLWLTITSLVRAEVLDLASSSNEDLKLTGSGLRPFQLAVVINEADPYSVLTGEYYARERRLPAENIIRVRFERPGETLGPESFTAVRAEVAKQTPGHVQAYALAWTFPYRVGCMSMTSAFAFGFDEAYCAQGCNPTRINRYFNANSSEPYRDYGIRPSMMLAANSLQDAKRLIKRGLRADGSFPTGTAYLIKSSDPARGVRAALYPEVLRRLSSRFIIREAAEPIQDVNDVMFYFIGMSGVPRINRNRFLPGAVADHLTSFGGLLQGSQQMNVLRWLKAGATASFGTVVEPCNFIDKFPHPGVLMSHYLDGDSVIEAYWKSVRTPGQGLFVGEPLAKPFGL